MLKLSCLYSLYIVEEVLFVSMSGASMCCYAQLNGHFSAVPTELVPRRMVASHIAENTWASHDILQNPERQLHLGISISKGARYEWWRSALRERN